MKHNFEEHRQNRIDNALKQAEKNSRKQKTLSETASRMANAIPFGQPILIGHHSEKRDRNYRNKIHNTLGRSVEAGNKAEYYSEKADSIEKNSAIFSDDPNGLQKLRDKLKTLQTLQEFMKAANKCIRKKDKDAFMEIPRASEEMWVVLNTPDCFNCLGFPAYKLQNNNAVIANTKKRIAELEKLSNKTTKDETINGIRLVQNAEANRVQLIFPSKPSEEVRKRLKKNGFHWCNSEGAWQRHLNDWAVHVTRELINSL